MAREDEYGAIEGLSVGASREEVATPLTAATIRWLVEENPAGKGFVVVAKVRADEQMVGYFLFYPKRLFVRGAPLDVFLYVTLFVAPEYRRVGVFSSMARYGLDLLKRAGVPFAYTVPNPRSTPGFIKMGIGQIGLIPFWCSPTGPLGLAANAASALGGFGVDVQEATAFDPTVAGLPPPRGAVVWGSRTVPELEWRFLRRPDTGYRIWNLCRRGELIGCAVSRAMHVDPFEANVLCDLWLRDDARPAAAALLRRLRREGGGGLKGLVVAIGGHSGSYAPGALLPAAMVPVPQRALPQPVALIGGPIGDAAGESWMMPGGSGQWYVTPYDWDVF